MVLPKLKRLVHIMKKSIKGGKLQMKKYSETTPAVFEHLEFSGKKLENDAATIKEKKKSFQSLSFL